MTSLCAVCSKPGNRTCPLCNSVAYCTAEHQYQHWISAHTFDCSCDQLPEIDYASLLHEKRSDLRAKAASLFQNGEASTDSTLINESLCYALALLHIGTRRSHGTSTNRKYGNNNTSTAVYGQAHLRDCVITAKILEAADDTKGAAYFWKECSDIVSREPYPEWTNNKAVYEYSSNQCQNLGEIDSVIKICNTEANHIKRTYGENQLDAAECYMRSCQAHIAKQDLFSAIETWKTAVKIQEKHSAKPEVKERLLDSYRFGYMLYTVTGNLNEAINVGNKGRDVARAGNTDKGLMASDFSIRIGDALKLLQKLPEALSYYEEAFRARATALGETSEDTILARKRTNKIRKILGYELIPGAGGGKNKNNNNQTVTGVLPESKEELYTNTVEDTSIVSSGKNNDNSIRGKGKIYMDDDSPRAGYEQTTKARSNSTTITNDDHEGNRTQAPDTNDDDYTNNEEGSAGPSTTVNRSLSSQNPLQSPPPSTSLTSTGKKTSSSSLPFSPSGAASNAADNLAMMAGLLTKEGKEASIRQRQQESSSSSSAPNPTDSASTNPLKRTNSLLTDFDISRPRSGPFANAKVFNNRTGGGSKGSAIREESNDYDYEDNDDNQGDSNIGATTRTKTRDDSRSNAKNYGDTGTGYTGGSNITGGGSFPNALSSRTSGTTSLTSTSGPRTQRNPVSRSRTGGYGGGSGGGTNFGSSSSRDDGDYDDTGNDDDGGMDDNYDDNLGIMDDTIDDGLGLDDTYDDGMEDYDTGGMGGEDVDDFGGGMDGSMGMMSGGGGGGGGGGGRNNYAQNKNPRRNTAQGPGSGPMGSGLPNEMNDEDDPEAGSAGPLGRAPPNRLAYNNNNPTTGGYDTNYSMGTNTGYPSSSSSANYPYTQAPYPNPSVTSGSFGQYNTGMVPPFSQQPMYGQPMDTGGFNNPNYPDMNNAMDNSTGFNDFNSNDNSNFNNSNDMMMNGMGPEGMTSMGPGNNMMMNGMGPSMMDDGMPISSFNNNMVFGAARTVPGIMAAAANMNFTSPQGPSSSMFGNNNFNNNTNMGMMNNDDSFANYQYQNAYNNNMGMMNNDGFSGMNSMGPEGMTSMGPGNSMMMNGMGPEGMTSMGPGNNMMNTMNYSSPRTPVRNMPGMGMNPNMMNFNSSYDDSINMVGGLGGSAMIVNPDGKEDEDLLQGPGFGPMGGDGLDLRQFFSPSFVLGGGDVTQADRRRSAGMGRFGSPMKTNYSSSSFDTSMGPGNFNGAQDAYGGEGPMGSMGSSSMNFNDAMMMNNGPPGSMGGSSMWNGEDSSSMMFNSTNNNTNGLSIPDGTEILGINVLETGRKYAIVEAPPGMEKYDRSTVPIVLPPKTRYRVYSEDENNDNTITEPKQAEIQRPGVKGPGISASVTGKNRRPPPPIQRPTYPPSSNKITESKESKDYGSDVYNSFPSDGGIDTDEYNNEDNYYYEHEGFALAPSDNNDEEEELLQGFNEGNVTTPGTDATPGGRTTMVVRRGRGGGRGGTARGRGGSIRTPGLNNGPRKARAIAMESPNAGDEIYEEANTGSYDGEEYLDGNEDNSNGLSGSMTNEPGNTTKPRVTGRKPTSTDQTNGTANQTMDAVTSALTSGALSFLIPRNYELGLAAIGNSAVATDPNASTAKGPSTSGGSGSTTADVTKVPPPLNTPEAATAYLGGVTSSLSQALAGLVLASDRTQSARWQGDGQLAIDTSNSQVLAGKEDKAVALQMAISTAVKALANTAGNEVTTTAPSVLKYREVLFTLIAEAGKTVHTVLEGSNINMDTLSQIAALPPGTTSATKGQPQGPGSGPQGPGMGPQGPGMGPQGPRPGGGPTGPGPQGPGRPGPPGSGTAMSGTTAAQNATGSMNTLEERIAAQKRQFDQQQQLSIRIPQGGEDVTSPNKTGSGTATNQAIVPVKGGSMMSQYVQDTHTDGLRQKGLVRAEDNPLGRRMKAVFLTANDILTSIQGRLLSLGLFRSLGAAARQRRTAIKLLFIGSCIRSIRIRNAQRVAGKMLGLGMMRMIWRIKRDRLAAAKAQTLGFLKRAIINRNSQRRTTKILSIGLLNYYKRKRDASRYITVMFASGLWNTLLRTQGNPQGFKYGVKAPAKTTKGPRVRGIHWDTLADVKGSVWEKKTSTIVLRQLFPDLRSVFTEKEKEKKAAAESEKPKDNKPKEITFLEAKDSRNFGIALSKFKSILPDFKTRKFASLREALERMDEAALGGAEAIEILEKNAPTKEMLKALDSYKDIPPEQQALLGFGEAYVFEMAKVKRFDSRVLCMKLKNTYAENVAAVEKDLNIWNQACRDILENPRLVEFLVDVIRPFGNELNRGAGKKDATGIRIQGLVKLGATKTADNSMTSLYYIVSVLAKHRPYLLEIVTEFKGCQAAMRLALQATQQNLDALKKDSVKVQNAVDGATKDNDQTFLETIGPFAKQVSETVAVLEERMKRLRADLLRSAEYLGEKEKSEKIDPIEKPETLFTEWMGFIDLLLKTVNEYRKKQADIAKKQKEEEAKAKKAAEQAAKAAQGGGNKTEGKASKPKRELKGLAKGPGPSETTPAATEPVSNVGGTSS